MVFGFKSLEIGLLFELLLVLLRSNFFSFSLLLSRSFVILSTSYSLLAICPRNIEASVFILLFLLFPNAFPRGNLKGEKLLWGGAITPHGTATDPGGGVIWVPEKILVCGDICDAVCCAVCACVWGVVCAVCGAVWGVVCAVWGVVKSVVCSVLRGEIESVDVH